MRAILTLTMLAACSNEEIHVVVACESGAMAGIERCETACRDTPTGTHLIACKTTESRCEQTFEFEGVLGCCKVAPALIYFEECQ